MAYSDTSRSTEDMPCSYEIREPLGSGSFGQVYCCTDVRSGEELACKIVPWSLLQSEQAVEVVRREVGIMQKLSGRHRGVVSLHEVGQDEEGSVHMVMDLCRGGDLFELLKANGRLPESAARFLLRQLASALSLCHVMGVVHRDIKPENILLDQCGLDLYDMTSPNSVPPRVQAKLADFGLALELVHGCKTSGFVGSPQYAAPEVVQAGPYGCKADIWSLGVVLYAMLSGRLPFASKAHNNKDLVDAISSGRVSFNSPAWNGVSDEAKDLIRWMMQVDEHKRPSASDVLFHPWVLGRSTAQRKGASAVMAPRPLIMSLACA